MATNLNITVLSNNTDYSIYAEFIWAIIKMKHREPLDVNTPNTVFSYYQKLSEPEHFLQYLIRKGRA